MELRTKARRVYRLILTLGLRRRLGSLGLRSRVLRLGARSHRLGVVQCRRRGGKHRGLFPFYLDFIIVDQRHRSGHFGVLKRSTGTQFVGHGFQSPGRLVDRRVGSIVGSIQTVVRPGVGNRRSVGQKQRRRDSLQPRGKLGRSGRRIV